MAVSGVGSSATSSATASARSGIADNFDTFLQLLTTQLKNQNPLDPLDTNQFTQQLVQFSSVEQQLKTNDYLSAMVTANANNSNTGVVSYIGKTVTAAGVKSELAGGQAKWQFNMKDAAMVDVTIKDANGNVVYQEQGALQAGSGQFSWDGKNNDGVAQANGTYSIQMTGVNTEGKTVAISTETTGVVTGIDFTGTEPVLLVGTARLNLSGVTSVRETTQATE